MCPSLVCGFLAAAEVAIAKTENGRVSTNWFKEMFKQMGIPWNQDYYMATRDKLHAMVSSRLRIGTTKETLLGRGAVASTSRHPGKTNNGPSRRSWSNGTQKNFLPSTLL